MKLFFCFSILLGSLATALSQTTEEEYLYATLGYKEQLLKGLDDKKGYSWRPLFQYKFVNDDGKLIFNEHKVSVFEFEGLFRSDEPKSCAMVAIFRATEGISKKDGVFWCLPHPKSGQEIFKKADAYFEEEVKFKKHLLEAYCLALQRLAARLSQQ